MIVGVGTAPGAGKKLPVAVLLVIIFTALEPEEAKREADAAEAPVVEVAVETPLIGSQAVRLDVPANTNAASASVCRQFTEIRVILDKYMFTLAYRSHPIEY